jgi:hypothetical protein
MKNWLWDRRGWIQPTPQAGSDSEVPQSLVFGGAKNAPKVFGIRGLGVCDTIISRSWRNQQPRPEGRGCCFPVVVRLRVSYLYYALKDGE